MTPIIGDILESTVGKAVNGLIARFLPPSMGEAERADVEAEITKVVAEASIHAEQMLTDRHKVDMASDSWLSKNIRPLVLVYLMGAWTIFAGVSISYDIDPAFVEMLKQMLLAAFGFYFVSRGAEKIVSLVTKNKK